MGTEDGKPFMVPRLSDWLAACDLLGIPPAGRLHVVSQSRYLHALCEGREIIPGLFEMDPADLAPPRGFD